MPRRLPVWQPIWVVNRDRWLLSSSPRVVCLHLSNNVGWLRWFAVWLNQFIAGCRVLIGISLGSLVLRRVRSSGLNRRWQGWVPARNHVAISGLRRWHWYIGECCPNLHIEDCPGACGKATVVTSVKGYPDVTGWRWVRRCLGLINHLVQHGNANRRVILGAIWVSDRNINGVLARRLPIKKLGLVVNFNLWCLGRIVLRVVRRDFPDNFICCRRFTVALGQFTTSCRILVSFRWHFR